MFTTTGQGDLDAGRYQIAFQRLSCLVLGPGTTLSHDALRLMHRHSTGVVITGEDGVRLYASLPAGPHHTTMARQHASLWADPARRVLIARRLYQRRFSTDTLPLQADLNALRGIEGQRAKAMYGLLAKRYNIPWTGRSYDRNNPEENDPVNQAINHSSTAFKACALVAVAISGAVPQLGFLHEDSGYAFALDIVDLYRDTHTLPTAFEAYNTCIKENKIEDLERITRRLAGHKIRRDSLVAKMIDDIKELLHAHDDPRDTPSP